MKASISTGAIALVLALTGCGGESGNGGNASNGGTTAAAVPAPNGGDWTQTVERTAEGGFRMGNPDAPVKLIEYASITCGHCADFAEQAGEPLREQYVKSGRVSWEYRPFMIFPTDPGIFMLLQCRGADPFFQLTDQLYATQKEWAGRLQQLSPAQQQQLAGLPPQQQIASLVQLTGVDQFFQQRGMPAAAVNSCLADEQSLQRLMEVTNTATNQMQVTGTPTFFINGEKVENAGDWQTLEPRLKQAVGG